MASKQVEIDPVTQNNLITWRLIQADKTRLAELELEYRNAIIPHVGFSEKPEGSQTVDIGEGFKLELDRPWYYSVKEKDTQVIMAIMHRLFQSDPACTADLLRWKPEISATAYRKLNDDQKRIIAPILDIKPGQPALNVVLPTEKKSR